MTLAALLAQLERCLPAERIDFGTRPFSHAKAALGAGGALPIDWQL